MRWRRALAAMLLGMATLLAACGEDDRTLPVRTPTPTPVPLTSAAVLAPGPFAVGIATMTFVDSSRPTMANRTYPGAPTRTLVTDIWYPSPQTGTGETEIPAAPIVDGAPFPLVIYSHGFVGSRSGGGFLARHLASHGYIVIAPDFPLTNGTAPGGPNAADLVNQPGDVHFLIDQMLALNIGDGMFAGRIDAERIALTGLSLGGSTTFLAAFHPSLRDPRVRAAAPMAGVACFFGPAFYDDRHVPLLILHGDIDAIVPYPQNALFAFHTANTPKYLVTLINGTHTGFTDGIEFFDSTHNVDAIGCGALRGGTGDESGLEANLGGASAGIIEGDCPGGCTSATLPAGMKPSRQHELTILSIFPFFEATLRGDAGARAFLQSRLAQENADLTLQSAP